MPDRLLPCGCCQKPAGWKVSLPLDFCTNLRGLSALSARATSDLGIMFKYLLIDNLCLEFHGWFRFIICGTGMYFGVPGKHVCLIFVDSLATAVKSLTGINLHRCCTVNCCCWCWFASTSKLNLIREKYTNVVKNLETGKFNFSWNSLRSYNLQFISESTIVQLRLCVS